MRKCILPLIFLILFSCQSSGMMLREKKHSQSPLMAKVFNGENRACPAVTVSLGKVDKPKYTAQTDITGKALFPEIPFATYFVTMEKEGYESVSFEFDYQRADQALYGRLYSFDQIVEEGKILLGEGKWKEAESWLVRAEAIGSDPYITTFYRSILLWKRGNPQEAVHILESLLGEEDYLPDDMLLFLADLYQYDLEMNEEAKELIGVILRHKEDSQLRDRLEELESLGDKNA